MKNKNFKLLKRVSLGIILIEFFFTTLCGCGLQERKVYYYELTLRNAGDEDILFVSVKTGKNNIGFGFAPSGAPNKGKTADGCAISFNGETKITWEDNDGKLYEFDLKLKDYYSKRKKIKGFIFTYLGNGKWDIKTKPDLNK